jgi:hypothetical protein
VESSLALDAESLAESVEDAAEDRTSAWLKLQKLLRVSVDGFWLATVKFFFSVTRESLGSADAICVLFKVTEPAVETNVPLNVESLAESVEDAAEGITSA